MSILRGFDYVARNDARILILGSMPGKASLAVQEYYANKQNAFWRIMGDLFAAGPELPYAQRLARLKAAGVALWDVMAACERASSLDADIVGASIRANDFSAFFAAHPGIHRVFFNGGTAEASFRRLVLPTLADHDLALTRLPSTSPAHAARRYSEKLAAWSAIVAPPNN